MQLSIFNLLQQYRTVGETLVMLCKANVPLLKGRLQIFFVKPLFHGVNTLFRGVKNIAGVIFSGCFY